MFVATVEGLDEFYAQWTDGLAALSAELANVALEASESGIHAAHDQHPYTDRTFRLTGSSHAERGAAIYRNAPPEGTAEMDWPVEYATFVDQGTSRSAPYPYTPIAEHQAQLVLEYGTELAIEKFADAINR